MIEFLANCSITHRSCCRNSSVKSSPSRIAGLGKVLGFAYWNQIFIFFCSSHESFRLQWRHGNLCKAAHYFKWFYVFRAEKREWSLIWAQKMKEDQKRTSLGTADEAQRSQKYIPTFLGGQMRLWSLRKKSDTDQGEKGSVCGKQRDGSWGKKNHTR